MGPASRPDGALPLVDDLHRRKAALTSEVEAYTKSIDRANDQRAQVIAELSRVNKALDAITEPEPDADNEGWGAFD